MQSQMYVQNKKKKMDIIMGQVNGALKTMMIDYGILEPIGNFNSQYYWLSNSLKCCR